MEAVQARKIRRFHNDSGFNLKYGWNHNRNNFYAASFGGLLLFTFAGRLNQRPNDILGTLAWSLLLVAKMNPSIFTDRRCTQMCAAEVGSKHTPGAPGQIFFAGVGHGETRSCLL